MTEYCMRQGGKGEWEWGMGNGEWGMGNGEWGMGNGEYGMGTEGEDERWQEGRSRGGQHTFLIYCLLVN